jgi:hypothetical protein
MAPPRTLHRSRPAPCRDPCSLPAYGATSWRFVCVLVFSAVVSSRERMEVWWGLYLEVLAGRGWKVDCLSASLFEP